MKTIKLYLVVWVTLLLVSCGRSHFTYYLKERNYTFSVEEKDKETILVLGEGDSIFFNSRRGQYLGVEFYLNDTSNIVYLPPDFSFHRIVKKNFKYKQIHKTVIIKRVIPIYPEVKTHYFGFYGGSERGGHHTFDVSYNDKYIGSLEPLEWK